MTVSELIALLRDVPQPYTILIWDDQEQDWSEDLTGKLLARDECGIVFSDKETDQEEKA
jgi:hypothetical protein